MYKVNNIPNSSYSCKKVDWRAGIIISNLEENIKVTVVIQIKFNLHRFTGMVGGGGVWKAAAPPAVTDLQLQNKNPACH